MPEGPDGKTIIIVKKVSGHAGHHGGAWKVAYADFVTAMMALFMVLWLVNSAAVPTRERIASYFRKPGVFQKGSGTPLEMGGAGILPDTFAPPADANSQEAMDKKIYDVDAVTGVVRDYFDAVGEPDGKGAAASEPSKERAQVEELIEQLEAAVAAAAGSEGSLLGEIDIKVDQRGLLIEIMDTDKASMFQLGSASIQAAAKEQLLKIASILKALPNPVDIEGHTDARPFKGAGAARYDNWNLSTDRANAARRVLLEAGMAPAQIARVVGYADQRPKILDDRLNASNRRITIAMRFTEQAEAALKGTKTTETAPKKLPLGGASVEEPTAAPLTLEALKNAAGNGENVPGNQLKVEVGRQQPEGLPQPVAEPEPSPAAAAPLQPAPRIEREKIFDADNPFFE